MNVYRRLYMILSAKRQEEIESLSKESLDVIAKIAIRAKNEYDKLKNIQGANPFATTNTWTDQSPDRLAEIHKINLDGLGVLTREPIIARVLTRNEDDEEKVYFISRGTPGKVDDSDAMFASYRAPIGRLASVPPGEEISLNVGGKKQYFEIVERTQYYPKNTDGQWDSINSIIEDEDSDVLTIESLRKLLKSSPAIQGVEDKDILGSLLKAEEQTDTITTGLRRRVLDRMSLRDQPILNKYQDEIFRLPLDSKLLIVGPPGTGKTTTLIRRLGQKINIIFLEEDEKDLIERVPSQDRISHEKSWVMFTPTDLLKQYVKEAFNREEVPASNERIKTWDTYQRSLARNTLGILKTGTKPGGFILTTSNTILDKNTINHQIDWFEAFTEYFQQEISTQLVAAIKWLSSIEDNYFGELIIRLKKVVGQNTGMIHFSTLISLNELSKEVKDVIKSLKKVQDTIINAKLNSLLNKNRSFLNELSLFVETIKEDVVLAEEVEEFDDDPVEGGKVPDTILQKAIKEYSVAIRSLARANFNKKKVSPKSKSGQIINWLEDRVVGDKDLKTIGEKIALQKYLRVLARPVKLYINDVPKQYRSFRKVCQKNNRWYVNEKSAFRNNEITTLEVDVILLLMLRNINELGKRLEKRYSDSDFGSNFPLIHSVFTEHRNQVLVDEATDFSPIQLACMMELTPNIKSFFACGDFNQRITSCGTQTPGQFNWLGADIEIRKISIPYRQSSQLNELASKVINEELGGEVSTSYSEANEGVEPILLEGTSQSGELFVWLKERILEIENTVQSQPSIAIFVTCEEEVKPTAEALQELLEEFNIMVVGCPDGKVMGQNNEIRVFDIQHIKGLEFEAVFFLNVDKLAKDIPDLFEKFLYVGITRAATYLGITCEIVLPEKIEHVRSLFAEDWK